jgi:hypothetical protein
MEALVNTTDNLSGDSLSCLMKHNLLGYKAKTAGPKETSRARVYNTHQKDTTEK